MKKNAPEAAAPGAPAGPKVKIFESPDQVQVARFAIAGVALHAMLSSGAGDKRSTDDLLVVAFDVADKFLAKAGVD